MTESPDQVVIVIRSEPNEHLRLHREEDGTVLLTHWSSDKPPSMWDKATVAVAQLGYGDPSATVTTTPTAPCSPSREWTGTSSADVASTSKRRGPKPSTPAHHASSSKPRRRSSCSASTSRRREQPYSELDAPHVPTGFGDLYFRPTPR